MTKSDLYFALDGEDIIRDQIPLSEILAVDLMRESKDLETLLSDLRARQEGRDSISETRKRSASSGNSDSTSYIGLNVFQIQTGPEGFNAGRTYYIQGDSREQSEEISLKVREMARIAHRRARGSSRLLRLRSRAKAIYDSHLFQGLVVVLILTVRTLQSLLYNRAILRH